MSFSIFNKDSNFHILFAGIISIFLGVGIARFAYTSILPDMLNQNAISLTFSGFLASFNYLGYISGAITAIFINNFLLKVKLFRIGLILSVITTSIFVLSNNETVWLISRIIAGFGSAMLLIVGPAIVVKKLKSKNITKTMGYYFTGIGFAIVFSELIARIALPSWEAAWAVLTITGVILIAYPYYILSFDKSVASYNTKHKLSSSLFTPFVLFLTFAYGTEGFGFVVQGTFLPTILHSIEGLESYANDAWLIVGIFAVPSTIIWMNMASRYGYIPVIQFALLLQVIGILIPTFTSIPMVNLLSAAIYGFTFAPLVALFINLGGAIAKENPVVLMGAFTSAYGIGQITAPLYAVYLTNLSGNYNYALYLTAFIVSLGFIALSLSKRLSSYSNLK